jgi:hypothetical protein
MTNLDERAAEILRRFHQSWADTENRYDDLIEKQSGFERLRPLRQFIQNLKSNGDNNFFRLGTSIHMLIISRSVDHGLRTDQKQIQIDTIGISDFEVTLKDGEKIYRQYRLSSLDDIKLSKMLTILKHTLVD